MNDRCRILDIPGGIRINLLGVIVRIDRIRIDADRAGLLGALLASLTCGGAAGADQLEALATIVRTMEPAEENGNAKASK
jgi:hypothetical protein